MELNELCHHGTKGMRWYERLYQNEDGSLTPLGKIHYRKLRKQKQQSTKKIKTQKEKQSKEEQIKKENKAIQNMNDEELYKYIIRKRSEKEALTLEKELQNLTPKQLSKGKQFIQDISNAYRTNPIVKDAVTELLINPGKSYINNTINKNAPINEALELKKKAEKAQNEADYYQNYMKALALKQILDSNDINEIKKYGLGNKGKQNNQNG